MGAITENKIGVCEWSLPVNGPFSLALAAQAGFEGIQLGDLGGAASGFPMNNKRIQEAYLEASAEHHITLQSLHPYGLQRQGTMLFPVDTPEGQEGKKSVSMCIAACRDMGIPQLMVSSFFATLVRNDWDFNVFAEQLKYACRLGKEMGVTIVYESVLSPERILRMIDIAGEDLKICYDILNPIRWGTGSPVDEIPLLGKKNIDHFHVKDAPQNLKGYCMLGEGRGDFSAVMAVIAKLDYKGWFISENDYTALSAASGEDFIALAAKDVQIIRDALKKF
jgi:sugar phosphate isomerase/epimerase